MKVAHEDWNSKKISPPMLACPQTDTDTKVISYVNRLQVLEDAPSLPQLLGQRGHAPAAGRESPPPHLGERTHTFTRARASEERRVWRRAMMRHIRVRCDVCKTH